MSERELPHRSQDSESASPTEDIKRRRTRSRWSWLLVVVVALAVASGYAITQVPGEVGLSRDSATKRATPSDTDRDGLLDELEESGWLTQDGSEYRTDPSKADTDGDGLTDGDEAGALVPNVQTELATNAQTENVYHGYSNPLLPDTDGDGLGDADEADLSLDPLDRDSDDDELEDGPELEVVGSAPDMADTDGDGFDDGYEDANRESQGLDPLWVDVKVSKWSYAADFAIGSVAGDAWRKDSFAWLAGNLASSGSSSIPVVGWIVGPIADARDAIASAIRGDWVGSGFSAVGAVPYAGDAVAIPGKAAKFVARNPELAAAVAAAIVAINKVPEKVKVEASKKIWRGWDDLRDAGASERSLLQLGKGRTNLDDLVAGLNRPGHVKGAPATIFPHWKDGERFLEDLYGANVKGVNYQVSVLTEGCIEVCNTSGVRIFDVFVDGVAHESKVGYVSLSESVQKQIRSDAWLVKNGQVESVHWHFFASAGSNTMGASKNVLNLLDELGISYTFHLPASP